MTRVLLAAVGAALLSATPTAAQGGGSVDHTPFERLLAQHVSTAGLVDYDAFARAPEFHAYLSDLADADVHDLSREEQLALWINAYNAYTIELINRHDERASIRNINRFLGLFAGKGPWRERFARVAGEVLTLDEIEHEIIRKEFSEPRIHFALVCAARGCPPLRREAYRGAKLDEQLDDQARRFLSDTDKNRIDVLGRVAYLSPIFDWYRDDFAEDDAGVGRYIARHFPPGPVRDLLEAGGFDIQYTNYNWRLNGQEPGTCGVASWGQSSQLELGTGVRRRRAHLRHGFSG